MCIINNLYPIAKQWYLSLPNQDNHTFAHQYSLLASAISLGSTLGALLTYISADKFGRKWAMAAACMFYLIGGCLIAFIYLMESLTIPIIGRFFVGVGFGLSYDVSMLWIGELAPHQLRGAFISCMQIMSGIGDIFGVLISTPELLGRQNLWFIVLLLGVMISTLLFPFVLYLPDSPRFLFFHDGPLNKTLKSIDFYYCPENLASTLEDLQAEQEIQIPTLSYLSVIKDSRFRNTLILCITLVGLTEVCGYIFIIQFSTVISMEAGLSAACASWMTTIIAGSKFICSFLNPCFVSRFNRRPIIWWCLWISAVCSISLTCTFLLFPQGICRGILVVIIMVLHVPINGLLFSTKNVAAVELCTQEIRAICLVSGRITASVVSSILSYSFLSLNAAIGMGPIFIFNALSVIVLNLYFHKKLPETRNVTFREVAEQLGANEENEPLIR